METLETAIIGCRRRARLALRDSRFRIRAGADPGEKGRQWLLQEVPDAALFSDHREMLATIRPLGAWDAVACGVRATESLRDENRPREVEPLPADLAAWLTRMEAGQMPETP